MVKKLNYKEFVEKIESFQRGILEKNTDSSDDYLEIIFSSIYRSVFLIYNLAASHTKLSIEVRATIPLDYPKIPDQSYYKNQLENMISLFRYLLELQEHGFSIDVLPEGIWYATLDLLPQAMDQKVYNLLNLNEKIL